MSSEILSKLPLGESAEEVQYSSSSSLESGRQDVSSSQATETPASSQQLADTQSVSLSTKADPSASSVAAPTTHDAIGSPTGDDPQQSTTTATSTAATVIGTSQALQLSTSSSNDFSLPKLKPIKSVKQQRNTSFTLFDESQTEHTNSTQTLTTPITNTPSLP
ncbi:MAG: hypothetical protein Q9218_007357, partial [Villophora microphyllina]